MSTALDQRYVEPSSWPRYRSEPDALWSMCLLHREQIERDPANAGWYRDQIAEIEAHLNTLLRDRPTAGHDALNV